ncbi:LysR family transcriptional regulator [Streptomyces antimicrobicus]|uniref:LysR family transcriptional regulator n=1 Tax=Streptomyces antimicrobicus TaxID=2883108 RepID=A0ABS8B4P7_9ACTN|nr:LysR family transcriptional regulator [Streptomyces antimicrobicus]MCB5179584.1 LysR family transcriptional regulator [Streptomyces antimicrobicus]
MDPHLLRTFVAVARLGSFSGAARDLGYTQSAVSQHIAALEGDLRTELLTRRPVRPTAAGARLLEHAGPLLLRLDAARADVARLAVAPPERITLAASPLALGPRTLTALPATGVTLRVMPRAEIPAAVATGAVDLGLVDGLAAPSDPLRLPDVAPLTVTGVGEDELAVLLPAGHPLAGRSALRLADLGDARWLDAPEAGIPLPAVRAALGMPGCRPSLRYDGTDLQTLYALSAAGHGLTLLPHRAAASVPPPAVAVPLSTPRLVHRTELLTPHTPTPPATALAHRLTTGA